MRFEPFRKPDQRSAEFSRPGLPWRIPKDAFRRGTAFAVMPVDVRGVDPNTTEVTLEQDTLTVTGEPTCGTVWK